MGLSRGAGRSREVRNAAATWAVLRGWGGGVLEAGAEAEEEGAESRWDSGVDQLGTEASLAHGAPSFELVPRVQWEPETPRGHGPAREAVRRPEEGGTRPVVSRLMAPPRSSAGIGD